jgi:hypothetical protein
VWLFAVFISFIDKMYYKLNKSSSLFCARMDFLMMTADAASPVMASFVVIAISTAALVALLVLRRRGTVSTASPSSTASPHKDRAGSHKQSVLDQLSQTERLRLQSRVANAKSAEDLYSIFDDFDILHNLDLLVEGSDQLQASPEQAFRDLVRDKININDESVIISAEDSVSPSAFQKHFHGLMLQVVRSMEQQSRSGGGAQTQSGTETQTETQAESGADGVSGGAVAVPVPVPVSAQGLSLEAALATHLCCHLARTRAGGDTFFCLADLFLAPQVGGWGRPSSVPLSSLPALH